MLLQLLNAGHNNPLDPEVLGSLQIQAAMQLKCEVNAQLTGSIGILSQLSI